MPLEEIKLADEFASTMQQLVAEAEHVAPEAFASTDAAVVESEEIRAELFTLNERIAGLERTLGDGLARVTAALPPKESAEQLQRVDQLVVSLCKTENVNQRLFNNLHQELTSYRDNFLRESLQKPFIRDLVMLFDDLTSLKSQMENGVGTTKKGQATVALWSENLQNSIHGLLEVLHRMEVNEIEPKEMVDRGIHKVVSHEPAEFPEEDGQIVLRLKRGFLWRDQVLRPEEVVAKRFTTTFDA
ncbi:MAG: nucleotide exchange factor GrpE [Verrucomicrobiota bacterium]|nr:nucleotide exchange factor GrpE [Verrucomicrobiota bacterium]